MGNIKKTKLGYNLYLYAREGGNEYYVFRGTIGGKRIERSLGPTSKLGLREAKLEAARMLATAKAVSTEGPTLNDIAEDALKSLGELRSWRPKTARVWRSLLFLHVLPVIGNKPVRLVDRDDVLRALSPIWSEGTRGPMGRCILEGVLNWATVRGYREGPNPAAWRGNLEQFLAPHKNVWKHKHRNAPTLDEIRKAVASVTPVRTPVQAVLLLVLCTVRRVSEVLLADASEFDGSLWTIPPEHQKIPHSDPQRVPLSKLAQKAVAFRKTEGLAFPGEFSGKVITTATLLLAFRRAVGRPDVTVHGVRSTFRDWCAERGVQDAVAEKALSHKWGSEVTAAYYRSDLLEQRRALMQAWADEIMPIDHATSSGK